MILFKLSAEVLAKKWVKSFEKSPIFTVVLSVIVSIAIAIGIYFFDKADKLKRETQRLQNLNYQTQIQQLNQTEMNIRQLLQFVESQKMTLRNTEDTISSLKAEQEKLKPLVQSDRLVVDAIFRLQEERNSASIWRERLIGFGFGIVASLVASFIWFIFSLLLKRRHNQSVNTDAAL